MGKNVLYVGSGTSSLLVENKTITNHTIVCVNNAWRLFKNNGFDIWIHSGDFPYYAYPENTIYKKEITHREYKISSQEAAEKLNWVTDSPQHYLGYSIFFQGLYWIMMTLKPKKIGLLGFDFDYNDEKVKKWIDNKKPNIQNDFNEKNGVKDIFNWANSFFGDMDVDSFYGHGLPDPLRLGTEHLIERFKLAEDSAKKLNIEIVNYSTVTGKINTFKKEKLFL